MHTKLIGYIFIVCFTSLYSMERVRQPNVTCASDVITLIMLYPPKSMTSLAELEKYKETIKVMRLLFSLSSTNMAVLKKQYEEFKKIFLTHIHNTLIARKITGHNVLEQGIEAPNAEGHTPLMTTASKGILYDLLIFHGAKVNAVAPDGSTPVNVAASTNHPNTLKYLLTHGADVNNYDPITGHARLDSYHPLTRAAQAGHVGIARILLEHKADVKICSTLHAVVESNLCNFSGKIDEFIELFSRYGISINNQRPRDGFTALHAAAVIGNLAAVRTLLDHGADHTIKNYDDRTPVQEAALKGKYAVAKELLILEELTPEKLEAEWPIAEYYSVDEKVRELITSHALFVKAHPMLYRFGKAYRTQIRSVLDVVNLATLNTRYGSV